MIPGVSEGHAIAKREALKESIADCAHLSFEDVKVELDSVGYGETAQDLHDRNLAVRSFRTSLSINLRSDASSKPKVQSRIETPMKNMEILVRAALKDSDLRLIAITIAYLYKLL